MLVLMLALPVSSTHTRPPMLKLTATTTAAVIMLALGVYPLLWRLRCRCMCCVIHPPGVAVRFTPTPPSTKPEFALFSLACWMIATSLSISLLCSLWR